MITERLFPKTINDSLSGLYRNTKEKLLVVQRRRAEQIYEFAWYQLGGADRDKPTISQVKGVLRSNLYAVRIQESIYQLKGIEDLELTQRRKDLETALRLDTEHGRQAAITEFGQTRDDFDSLLSLSGLNIHHDELRTRIDLCEASIDLIGNIAPVTAKALADNV